MQIAACGNAKNGCFADACIISAACPKLCLLGPQGISYATNARRFPAKPGFLLKILLCGRDICETRDIQVIKKAQKML